jgi:hypothetical protein
LATGLPTWFVWGQGTRLWIAWAEGERCDEMGLFDGTGWSRCVVSRECKMDWICFDELEDLFLV